MKELPDQSKWKTVTNSEVYILFNFQVLYTSNYVDEFFNFFFNLILYCLL